MGKMQPEDEKMFGDTSYKTLQGPSANSHWILWLTIILLAFVLMWAYFGTVEEVASAKGKVIPSQKTKVIQYLEKGRIEQILVKEGQQVNKGDVLMQIDDTQFSSSYQEGNAKIAALQAKIARLQAETTNKDFEPPQNIATTNSDVIANEQALFLSRKNKLNAKMGILNNQAIQKKQKLEALTKKKEQLTRSYNFVARELKMTEPLVSQGAVSEVELLRLQRAANDLKGEMVIAQIEIPKIQSEVKETEHKIAELQHSYNSESFKELTEANTELAGLSAFSVALKDRVNQTSITSPVKGTIQQIYMSTIGGVVSPGMKLIEVVPTDPTLLIEAKIKPSKVAFIKKGQHATVKITAYDYSIYGTLSAKLEHISADTSTDPNGDSFYEIWVRTDQNYLVDKSTGKKLSIIPGMDATVDIIVGEKTVMQYILRPILKTKQSALREK